MEERSKTVEENEIDLLELVKVLWSRRYFVFKVTGVFIILGVIIAFTSKVEYQSSCKLLPESQDGIPDLGGLGGLAGLAGVDLSGMSNNQSIPPEIYPEIAKSFDFQDSLIRKSIYFDKYKREISPYEYFLEVDIPFTRRIVKYMNFWRSNNDVTFSEGFNFLTKEEVGIYREFLERQEVQVDKLTGIIIIKVEMPDKYASAAIARNLLNQLTDEIANYRLQKVKLNLDFVTEMKNEAYENYIISQQKVASFIDNNKNLYSASFESKLNNLNQEMDLKFDIYKNLSTQLEQAKIQYQEKMPVFTVVESIIVPSKKSKPKRGMIISLTLLLGLAISSGYVILKKEEMNEK